MSFQYDFYDKMIERLRSGIKSSYKFKDSFVVDEEPFEKDSSNQSLFGGNIERPEKPEIQIDSESNSSSSSSDSQSSDTESDTELEDGYKQWLNNLKSNKKSFEQWKKSCRNNESALVLLKKLEDS